MLARVAQTANVTLLLFTDPAIPPSTVGDAARLRQVLLNLAGNAIKFSGGTGRSGQVSIRANLLERSARDASIEIDVADDGIGMDDATLSRLFTPFTQADGGTTRTFGGSGLGLSISRRLVELMGGTIAVKSRPRQGSTFSVRLTLPVLPEAAPGEAESRPLQGLLCLVVGAELGPADDLERYLEHAGARAERVAHAVGAVQWLARCPPEVCVVVAAPTDAAVDRTISACRAFCSSRPALRVCFVAVARERRAVPRAPNPGVVRLAGEAMHRDAFLKAVARAAGRAPLETEPVAGMKAETASDLSAKGRQQRPILIAEDNEINQKVLLKQLALLGFDADCAATGHEALEFLQRSDYALLITDLHMPKMDGYELAAAVRKSEAGARYIPIVALTAVAVKGEAKRCRAAGMDDYMTKPLQLDRLRAMLNKWMPDLHDIESGLDAGAVAGLFAEPAQALAAPADLNVLAALVGSNPEVISEMVVAFRRSATRASRAIRAAIADSNCAAAADAAHLLKSGAHFVGAQRLFELCATIERAGTSRRADTLRTLLPHFDSEMDAVDRYLDGAVGESMGALP
jgi:two-component system, sensor histidine kinase and response regulator